MIDIWSEKKNFVWLFIGVFFLRKLMKNWNAVSGDAYCILYAFFWKKNIYWCMFLFLWKFMSMKKLVKRNPFRISLSVSHRYSRGIQKRQKIKICFFNFKISLLQLFIVLSYQQSIYWWKTDKLITKCSPMCFHIQEFRNHKKTIFTAHVFFCRNRLYHSWGW